MKIHRSIVLLTAALTLGTGSTALAEGIGSFFDVFVDLDDNPGPISQPIRVSPGGSVSVQFGLDTDAVPTIGFDYELNVVESAASGKIHLTGRDNTGSVFSDYLASNATVLSGLNAVLDPSTVNLGALISDTGSPLADDLYSVANLTLLIAPNLAPGFYTISATNAFITDDLFNSQPVTINSFQLEVVPEPGTAAFGLICLGAVAARRRRMKTA